MVEYFWWRIEDWCRKLIPDFHKTSRKSFLKFFECDFCGWMSTTEDLKEKRLTSYKACSTTSLLPPYLLDRNVQGKRRLFSETFYWPIRSRAAGLRHQIEFDYRAVTLAWKVADAPLTHISYLPVTQPEKAIFRFSRGKLVQCLDRGSSWISSRFDVKRRWFICTVSNDQIVRRFVAAVQRGRPFLRPSCSICLESLEPRKTTFVALMDIIGSFLAV